MAPKTNVIAVPPITDPNMINNRIIYKAKMLSFAPPTLIASRNSNVVKKANATADDAKNKVATNFSSVDERFNSTLKLLIP
jgi:hypothetical protein